MNAQKIFGDFEVKEIIFNFTAPLYLVGEVWPAKLYANLAAWYPISWINTAKKILMNQYLWEFVQLLSGTALFLLMDVLGKSKGKVTVLAEDIELTNGGFLAGRISVECDYDTERYLCMLFL